MSKEEYNIYHFNSGNDDVRDLEAILEKTFNDPEYTLLSHNDSILPSGAYVAVLHYTVHKSEVAATENRVSADADL